MQKVLNNPYMVVVDGNSVDRTIEIAKNMGADVMLQEGKGKGDAMFQGIERTHFQSALYRLHRRRLHLSSASTFLRWLIF